MVRSGRFTGPRSSSLRLKTPSTSWRSAKSAWPVTAATWIKVETAGLVVGSSAVCGLRRSPCQVEISDSECVGGDEVGHVDDGARHDVVDVVAFEEPAPSRWSQAAERFASHELQRRHQIGDALGTTHLPARVAAGTG